MHHFFVSELWLTIVKRSISYSYFLLTYLLTSNIGCFVFAMPRDYQDRFPGGGAITFELRFFFFWVGIKRHIFTQKLFLFGCSGV